MTVLLGLLHLDFHHPLGAPGVWLLPLILLATVLIASEMLDFWRARADCPTHWPVYFGALIVAVATCVPMLTSIGRSAPAIGTASATGTLPDTLVDSAAAQRQDDGPATRRRTLHRTQTRSLGSLDWTWLGFVGALGLVVAGEMGRYTGPGRATSAIALGVLAITYAGVLPSFLVQLRLWHDARWGMSALVSLLLVVKAADTGAYFTGRALGRHKLAPVLSPGKTIEGVVGGLAAAIAAAWLCYAWLLPRVMQCETIPNHAWRWALYGAIIMVVGLLGDLAESLFKRDAERKDSSRWLPGLGGVLDIFDSVLFAAPIAYFCWALRLIGPR